MSATTTAPNNKSVTFKAKPMREPSGAAKNAMTRKKAKSAIRKGLVSEKAATRHLKGV
jgi:hypothetical protein